MKASEAIKVCLPPDLRREVECTAEEEGRSLSNVVRRVVTQWAAQRRAAREQQQAA
jgi:metal-responsive CopG/Arc/MetJ family transcriptional regulator